MSSEDPDLLDYINQGDKWLSELLKKGVGLSTLLTLLEGKEK